MSKWTTQEMPGQTGKNIVITGANSGIGFVTALEFAGKWGNVFLACRNQDKGRAAVARIREQVPDAQVTLMELDLADLASVRAFSSAVADQVDHIDVLINNAGVMALPYRKTADGFEMQLGTNHLGHFALTGSLFALLEKAPKARVVNVASQAHRFGKMHWQDLMWEKRYSKWGAYGQSKLANLLFTFEMHRRLGGESTVGSLAAHPGYSATNLQSAGARMRGAKLVARFMGVGNGLMAQSPGMGALPSLRAATDLALESGDYVGPGGLGEWRGHPVKVGTNKRARNEEDAVRLWELSEQLTGVCYLS